jgi:hypothetical protein
MAEGGPEHRTHQFLSQAGSLIARLRDSTGVMHVPSSPTVGVFGKHPGWPDHLALPLRSAALREFRQFLYNTGIRAVIERGIWGELEISGQAIPFGHSFLSGAGRSWIVGRLWTSADQIGRREYPMVACVHFAQARAADALAMAGPVLERLEAACRNANTSEQVLAAIEKARAEMVADWAEWVRAIGVAEVADSGATIEGLNFYQMLAHIRRWLRKILHTGADFLRAWWLYARWRLAGPEALRVSCEGTAVPLLHGNQIATERAGPRCRRLVICPDDQAWVDLILGRPGPLTLAVLRRSSVIPREDCANDAKTPRAPRECEDGG